MGSRLHRTALATISAAAGLQNSNPRKSTHNHHDTRAESESDEVELPDHDLDLEHHLQKLSDSCVVREKALREKEDSKER
jgi:hypothetical protein